MRIQHTGETDIRFDPQLADQFQQVNRVAEMPLWRPPRQFARVLPGDVEGRLGEVAQELGQVEAFSRELFEAYWGREEDVSTAEALAAVAENVGLDGAALLDRLVAPEIKDRLRTNTEELIERGGYGSPTLFVDGKHMYFGNDRLPLVERRLESPPA